MNFFPLNKNISMHSVNLTGVFHPDTADRVMDATGLHLGAAKVSAMPKFMRIPMSGRYGDDG